MKLSKTIIISSIVTLVAAPILTTPVTVSATQNDLESTYSTFEDFNDNITNFELVSQSDSEIVYNYSQNNTDYQTIEEIDFESGEVNSTTYEINDSTKSITVSTVKTELIDNS